MKPSHLAIVLALGTLCVDPAPGHAQGTLQTIHITFDEPVPQPPGTGVLIQRYRDTTSRACLSCRLPVRSGSVEAGGGDIFAENGTTYLQGALGSSLMWSFTNGALFDMISVDLAVYLDATARFVGYRADGSTVTVDLMLDGIFDGAGPLADFETFEFDGSWTGLTRMEIPRFESSLDNLVVAIPEPSACALLVSGGLVLAAFKWRRKL